MARRKRSAQARLQQCDEFGRFIRACPSAVGGGGDEVKKGVPIARLGLRLGSPSSGSSDAGEVQMGGKKRAAPPRMVRPIARRGSSDAGEVKMGGRKRAAPSKMVGPIAFRGIRHRTPSSVSSDADGTASDVSVYVVEMPAGGRCIELIYLSSSSSVDKVSPSGWKKTSSPCKEKKGESFLAGAATKVCTDLEKLSAQFEMFKNDAKEELDEAKEQYNKAVLTMKDIFVASLQPG